jgi:integrase/recombinase XerD
MKDRNRGDPGWVHTYRKLLDMQPILLKPIIHHGEEQVGIFFSKDGELNLLVRKIKGVKWSQTHGCWYLPLNKESLGTITGTLGSKTSLDTTALNAYLKKRSEVKATLITSDERNANKPIVASSAWKLSKENLEELRKFVEQLKLKAYSPSTIKTYRNEFLQLLQLLKTKPVNELTTDDLRRYFVYCLEKLKLTENTLHSRINAVKFYFEQVLRGEKFFWEIPRPKKRLTLPKVLSEREISRLFNGAVFLKHKAILFTAYSAGLRVSEIINLQWKHIDRQRGQILIEQAKGKKDRYVILSPILEDILIAYYRDCKTKPVKYVFESAVPGQPYSARSAQAVFQQAKQRAGIKKEVSFHSLRHSFATHLLEKGTDVRYIQELLGHFSIKTTTRYLHVAKEKLVVIDSPLDSLWKQGGIEWDG